MNVTDTSIAFFLCGDMNVAKHFFTIWRSGHAAMEQLILVVLPFSHYAVAMRAAEITAVLVCIRIEA